MRYVVAGIALINGVWMLIDGVYVTANGKYIGPEKPGPWASVVGLTGIDVFRVGPVFVIYGLAWLVFAVAIVSGTGWARSMGLILSILTLWYLPFGTLISIVILSLLIFVLRN